MRRAFPGWLRLALLAALLPGCGGRPEPIVLLGLDGLDWDVLRPLIARGELPHFARFVEEGASGVLRSEQPLLSPVVWTTIATGLPPDRHRVLDFTAPGPEGQPPVVVTSLQRQTKAFWNVLAERGVPVGVIGWWATWPAEPLEHGFVVSDRIGYHAFIGEHRPDHSLVYPPELQALALGALRAPESIRYDESRAFMDVTPEAFAADTKLRFEDPIAHFRYIYATLESTTRLAELLFRRERPRVLAVYYEAADTAGHTYARYAPPPLPGVTEQERRRFGGSFEAFYRHLDRRLGELMQVIGPGATWLVVSDHGFRSGAARPHGRGADHVAVEAVRWHRPEGVILALGPRVPKGARIENASIRDVCPTLLALAGVPPSEEMPGRVLREILPAGQPLAPRVASYEEPGWREQRTGTLAGSAVDAEMAERLRALGYLEEGDAVGAAHAARSELNLGSYYEGQGELERAEESYGRALALQPGNPLIHASLAQLLVRRGRFEQAIPHLLAARERLAGDADLAQALVVAYFRTGRLAEALPLAEQLVAAHAERSSDRLNLAAVYRVLGRLAESRALLEALLEAEPRNAQAWNSLGDTLADLQQRSRAVEAYRQALRLHPSDAYARARLAALGAGG